MSNPEITPGCFVLVPYGKNGSRPTRRTAKVLSVSGSQVTVQIGHHRPMVFRKSQCEVKEEQNGN